MGIHPSRHETIGGEWNRGPLRVYFGHEEITESTVRTMPWRYPQTRRGRGRGRGGHGGREGCLNCLLFRGGRQGSGGLGGHSTKVVRTRRGWNGRTRLRRECRRGGVKMRERPPGL